MAAEAASGIVAQTAEPAPQPMPQFSRLTVPFFAPLAVAKVHEVPAPAEIPPLDASAEAAPAVVPLVAAAPAPASVPVVEVKRKAEAKPVPQSIAKQTPAAPVEPMFKVINVRSSDVLNVRDGPSWDHEVVGALPPGGRSVAMTGACRGQWCPVRHLDVRGWVNRTFLESEDGAVVQFGSDAQANLKDSADAPRGCLSAAAKELLGRIEGKFGPMQLVSTCRAGATVAGTGKPSRHRDGNAIDFTAGARKQAVVEWLIANHANGGTMTYRDMDHIHIDIGPHFLAIASGGRSGRDWSSDKMGLSAAK